MLSYKSLGKGKAYVVMTFAFPSSHYKSLISRQWLRSYLLMGKCEWISYCVWFVGTAFVFPVKLALSQSISLLAFLLFSLHPVGGGSSRWVTGWWWGQPPTTLIPALCMESGEVEDIEHRHLYYIVPQLQNMGVIQDIFWSEGNKKYFLMSHFCHFMKQKDWMLTPSSFIWNMFH